MDSVVIVIFVSIFISFLFLFWLDDVTEASLQRFVRSVGRSVCLSRCCSAAAHRSQSVYINLIRLLRLMCNVHALSHTKKPEYVFNIQYKLFSMLFESARLSFPNWVRDYKQHFFSWIIYEVKWMKMSIVLQSFWGSVREKNHQICFTKFFKRNVYKFLVACCWFLRRLCAFAPIDFLLFLLRQSEQKKTHDEFIHWIEWLPSYFVSQIICSQHQTADASIF